MSRYVSVGLEVRSADELQHGLAALGLTPHQADGFEVETALGRGGHPAMLMLDGSLECAGEPVHLRFVAGTLGTVEDFGLRLDEGGPVLVCGEYDTKLLERKLLAPLVAAIAARRLELAGQTGRVVQETDGTIRIIVEE